MTDFTQKKFGLISLGCDKNRVDAEKLLAQIKARGCAITNDIEEAQVLIINTCSFLEASRKEAIETIIECASYKEQGGLEKIVVTGCLPQKFIGDIYEELTEADVFLGTYDYDVLFDALSRAYEDGRCNMVGEGKNPLICDRVVTTPLHYAYLKIADGCNNRCTYCLIPSIRGKYFSYPMEKLVEEAANLGDVSELILVAQDVTRYGIDLYGEKKLCEILQKLTALDNINSVRLLYCYPEMIDDTLISEIRDNKKIIKYLDIPFQHSEDRVLKMMNRRGTRLSSVCWGGSLSPCPLQIYKTCRRRTFLRRAAPFRRLCLTARPFPVPADSIARSLCVILRSAVKIVAVGILYNHVVIPALFGLGGIEEHNAVDVGRRKVCPARKAGFVVGDSVAQHFQASII